MSEAPFYRIRIGQPSDHACVVDTWMNAHSQSANGEDHGPNYISEQKALIRRILARPTTELRVACDPLDTDGIHGYAVVERAGTPRIYYIYVKGHSRKLGIAKALVKDLILLRCFYTHKPKRSLISSLPRPPGDWTYSYFANFEEKPLGESYASRRDQV